MDRLAQDSAEEAPQECEVHSEIIWEGHATPCSFGKKNAWRTKHFMLFVTTKIFEVPPAAAPLKHQRRGSTGSVSSSLMASTPDKKTEIYAELTYQNPSAPPTNAHGGASWLPPSDILGSIPFADASCICVLKGSFASAASAMVLHGQRFQNAADDDDDPIVCIVNKPRREHLKLRGDTASSQTASSARELKSGRRFASDEKDRVWLLKFPEVSFPSFLPSSNFPFLPSFL
jgi:hypothetical protein